MSMKAYKKSLRNAIVKLQPIPCFVQEKVGYRIYGVKLWHLLYKNSVSFIKIVFGDSEPSIIVQSEGYYHGGKGLVWLHKRLLELNPIFLAFGKEGTQCCQERSIVKFVNQNEGQNSMK